MDVSCFCVLSPHSRRHEGELFMTRQVLLYSNDFPAASKAIEEAGGQLLHVFSHRVFVAALPAEVDPRRLPHVSMTPPADLEEIERLLAEGWEALQQQQATL